MMMKYLDFRDMSVKLLKPSMECRCDGSMIIEVGGFDGVYEVDCPCKKKYKNEEEG